MAHAHHGPAQQKKSVRLPHSAIVKAPGLLPMMYSISELCDELDIPRHLVRTWLKNELPHERDHRNYIWVNGRECADWIEECRKSKRKHASLAMCEIYCLRCNKGVRPLQSRREKKNGLVRLTGRCPSCGGQVYKGVKDGQPEQL